MVASIIMEAKASTVGTFYILIYEVYQISRYQNIEDIKNPYLDAKYAEDVDH